jgi:hypothetical protein
VVLFYWIINAVHKFKTSANSFNQGGSSTENRDSTSVQRGFRATPNAAVRLFAEVSTCNALDLERNDEEIYAFIAD